MFFFNRIKKLEAQVAELKTRNQILEDRTEILADRMRKGFNEIDELYALLVNSQNSPKKNPVAADTPAMPKPQRKHRTRKKNGKENTEAAK